MNGTATTLTPTEGATSNGVEPAGGAPTNTVRLRSSLPARIVSVAVPATPVTIEMSELCDPTGTSEAVAAATAGFELVIVTVVAAAAGVERTCTRVAVLCATGVTMEPTDGGFAMLNPTIGAVSSGVDPGGGGPTKTVTLRTSLPARMINVATPAAPVMISFDALCSPAATPPLVAVATPGFVLMIETAVAAPAGAESTWTSVVVVCPGAVPMNPADGGFAIAVPIDVASGDSSLPGTTALTDTLAAAVPCVDDPRTVVAPAATPAISAVTAS